ncbi:MAG TPA: sulfotransferase [Candidatus Limnocylindrales bacterium]|nr:sulfotransferase [Candidatus Limnocylindrales bacterium]
MHQRHPDDAAALRKRLRYVRISSDRLDLSLFPDFLIIGPQRTGTTWLHANLREHPEIFLSEPKELYFFSRLKSRDSARFESDELDWYLSFFDEPLWHRLYRQWRTYRRHGRLYRPLARGEATASYAAMDDDLIAEIAAISADVKIIMMVRDPVDRAWSHAKKDLVRNRGRRMADVADAEFQQFFADPYQLRCAQYEENLARWQAHFGAANVFVGSFDDVEGRPEELLARVTAFLGVSSDPRYIDPQLVRSAVNPTGQSEVPERYRRYLEQLLAEPIASWKRNFAR